MRFTHGTIECTGLPREIELPMECPLVFDPRTATHRGRPIDLDRIERWLATSGYPIRLSIPPKPGFESAKDLGLRDYQAAALDAWELGGRRGVIQLPTGSGKTRVAIGAILSTDATTLVLVPTRVLLRQWEQELRRYVRGRVGILGDGAHALAPLTVATFASANRWMPHLGDRFRLLVVDEAHHGVGGTLSETLEMSSAVHRLGITATPPRGPGLLRLSHLLGPACFGLRPEKLAGTHLARLRVVSMELGLTLEERSSYGRSRARFEPFWQRFIASAQGAPWSEFVAVCRRSDEGRAALRGWHEARRIASFTKAKAAAVDGLLDRHRQQGDQVVVFTADKESTYAIARRNLVMPVTSDISRSERRWALESFAAGSLRVLVSARVLNEGLDTPGANVAILVGGTQGDREYFQRIGRVLRPQPGKEALVYELISVGTAEVGRAARRR